MLSCTAQAAIIKIKAIVCRRELVQARDQNSYINSTWSMDKHDELCSVCHITQN